uniref:Uncharacterized protein AlNc14C113G6435 n=1 Tax=Albugo laibachii Nc14 TaxID=890382 RepID=F0WIP2_9STRA|nr:conserved hypothetical protein [Albugo laibachii Nc14]|eukprot:CCA21133.1 conserved hypothetical protein [Albugo laibachii Nc14]
MGNKPSRIQSSDHATDLNPEDAFDGDSVTKCTIGLTPDLINHLNDLEKANKSPHSSDASPNERLIQIDENMYRKQLENAYRKGEEDGRLKIGREIQELQSSTSHQAKEAKKLEVEANARIRELVDEISQKKYNAPIKQVQCTEERLACLKCYQENPETVLRCKEVADAFIQCGQEATDYNVFAIMKIMRHLPPVRLSRWTFSSSKHLLYGIKSSQLLRVQSLPSCSYSTRQNALLEMDILSKLRQVPDQLGLKSDIVTLGRVKNVQLSLQEKSVYLTLEAPNGALLDVAEQWKKDSMESLRELDWIQSLHIETARPKPKNLHAKRSSTLENVSEIVAVSSCKGGVGKSTVAVNLAYSLVQRGARVGILDADIYGPSLPTMINPEDRVVRPSPTNKGFILPLEFQGVKLMSFGFVNQKAAPGAGGVGAAVMRGPMVSKLIDQLILATQWGSLDFLIVDMPPGTGDIQMSLTQQMPISAAVIVTTPQRLSTIDVEKGIVMFQNLKVPSVAVVENMAFFDCIHGTRHYPFGRSHMQELAEKYSIEHMFQLPITQESAYSADHGKPFVLGGNDPNTVETYKHLAEAIAREVVKLRHKALLAPEFLFNPARGILLRSYTSTHAKEITISAAQLRAQCRCAQCVDEFTGKQLLDITKISTEIVPTTIQRKGNYAYAVAWSDGHSASLYTDQHLQQLISEKSSS